MGWQPDYQNSKKRAERSEGDVYEPESSRLSQLWLSASSSACHGLLIITIDNAITYKTQRDKYQRTETGERGNYWHADASRWCYTLDTKYLKEELADAKAENDALRDDVAAGRRQLHIKAVCQSVREAHHYPAWIMQPPPTGRHRWTGLFHPQKRLITMQKQLEEPRSILMSSANGICPYRWATHAIVLTIHASSWV